MTLQIKHSHVDLFSYFEGLHIVKNPVVLVRMIGSESTVYACVPFCAQPALHAERHLAFWRNTKSHVAWHVAQLAVSHEPLVCRCFFPWEVYPLLCYLKYQLHLHRTESVLTRPWALNNTPTQMAVPACWSADWTWLCRVLIILCACHSHRGSVYRRGSIISEMVLSFVIRSFSELFIKSEGMFSRFSLNLYVLLWT